MSLKQKTLSGVKWTTVSTIFISLIQISQLIILSRLLTPSDFGLMAIVMIVIGFSQAFLDMGTSNAIIHKQIISHEQLSTLYWINILTGLTLFGIIFLLAPFISSFYNEPKLTDLIIYLSFTFLIQPFGQQFFALLKKDFKFRSIAKIEVTNKLISLILSVYLAYLGFGVYALVYGVLAGTLIQTFLFMIKGFKEFKPSFIFQAKGVKSFLGFGLFQMGEQSMNYFMGQVDNIIIGKLLGMETLGLYNLVKHIIKKVVLELNGIVNKVTFPMLSKLQHDNEKLKKVYMKILNLLTLVQFPFLVFLFFYGYDVFLFLLGDEWVNTETLIKLFSLYCIFLVYGNPIGTLILSKGKANWSFYSNLIYFFLYPISVYFFTWNYGIEGAIYGFINVSILSLYPYWKYLISKLINIRFSEYYSSLFFQCSISFLSGYCGYLFSSVYESFIWELIVYFILMLPIYIALNFFLNRNIFHELLLLIKNGLK
jgi:O-antigen/teichoic acid export membrane protein